MTEVSNNTFTHMLVGDVERAHRRLFEEDSQSNRREYVRTVFAAIEGLHWRLRGHVLEASAHLISAHECAAMSQETYAVDDKGNVRVLPRYLSLPSSIRLLVKILKRYRPEYELDFTHVGWSGLKRAIEVRNRLVHPKTMEELTVSEEDLEHTARGFRWILALVIEVLEETVEHKREIAAKYNIEI